MWDLENEWIEEIRVWPCALIFFFQHFALSFEFWIVLFCYCYNENNCIAFGLVSTALNFVIVLVNT